MEASDCGAACLAMVLSFHGRDTSLKEARDVVGSGRGGVNARDLVEAGGRFGLRVRGVRLEVDDMQQLPRGAILHWGFTHFVVFDRLVKRGIHVLDPALGARLISWDHVKEQFTGVALLAESTAALEPRRARRRTLLSYFARFKRHRGALLRVLSLSILLQGLALALPLTIGAITDRVVPSGDWSLLAVIAVGALGVSLFQVATVYLRGLLLNAMRTALDAELAFGFVDHLVSLPYAFFLERPAGDLLQRFESNRSLRNLLTATTLSTVLDGGLVVTYLIVLLWVSPWMGAVALLLGALQVVMFFALRRPTLEMAAQELEAQSRSQSRLVDMLGGMETIKSLGAEQRAADRWGQAFVDELNVSLRRARLGSITGALHGGLTVAAPLAILLIGAAQVIDGQLTIGMMLTLQALAIGFLSPLGDLIAVAFQLQEVRSHVERIEDVMTAVPESDRTHPRAALTLTGKVELQQVSFRYRAREPLAVDSVTVLIAAGQKVAIVGRSGAGKSTLARLLVGLYIPESGTITFDDRPLGTLDLTAVRGQIGVVSQDARIFGTTIRENLLLGSPDADLPALERAARAAVIHDDIAALPLGYDTALADAGATLSGGQRQRLALARALLRQPKLLLLDEATSDLDTVTEAAVMDNLAALNATRIVVAHRLSTIVDADLILVMSHGTIVERGRHAELLGAQGVYAELVAAQTIHESGGDGSVRSGA